MRSRAHGGLTHSPYLMEIIMPTLFNLTNLTPEQQQRMVTVYDHFDTPFDSHQDDVASTHAAMKHYILTGELPTVPE